MVNTESFVRLALSGSHLGDHVDSLDLASAAQVMSALSIELDRLSEMRANVQRAWDFMRITKIPDMMASMGAKTVTLDGIGRITIMPDAHANVPADKRLELHEWLTDHGFDDMIQPTVNASTLKAWYRRRFEAGEELPPDDVVKYTPFQKAQLTKVS